MKLRIENDAWQMIRNYLFQDSGERVILGLARRGLWGRCRLSRLVFPGEEAFRDRKQCAVTLKGSAAYPLFRTLQGMQRGVFVLIHSHPGEKGAGFSPVDDWHDRPFTAEVREWNAQAGFLRLVLTRGDHHAEWYDYASGRFRPLEVD